ncbi:MAG: cupin domain-containing protein [Rhizobiales bacterium]|nr:cupin domain-containing protein [Hyphomicrobiales bacterium]
MGLQVRRVVTGHDGKGRAIVKTDNIMDNVVANRPGATWTVLWSTEGQVDNNNESDGAQRKVGTSHDDGTVFRIVRYEPGVARRNHRTDSLDYGILLSGQLDMELDDGVVVHLKAGDVVVQRGTIHNWANNGTEPAVMAFVLLAAPPYLHNGKPLDAAG